MSDASGNPSCESPASPTLTLPPLPIPPPEVSIEVDEDQEFAVTPPLKVPSPLSPRSALAMLQAFGTEGSTKALRNVAQAASRALITRTAAYENTVRNLQEEVTQLHQQAAPTPVVPCQDLRPRHFIQNNG